MQLRADCSAGRTPEGTGSTPPSTLKPLLEQVRDCSPARVARRPLGSDSGKPGSAPDLTIVRAVRKDAEQGPVLHLKLNDGIDGSVLVVYVGVLPSSAGPSLGHKRSCH